MHLVGFAVAAALASIHLFAGKLRFLDVVPRSRWLSAAGGASVAYIFVHVFPELGSGQQVIERTALGEIVFLKNHVYLIALLGLVTFYGLERVVKTSRAQIRDAAQEDATSPGVFWLHMAAFGLYNALIGYLLLHREQPGIASLVLFGMAMALHFFVNDYGLRQDHKSAYHDAGRWLLSAAVLVGYGFGAIIELERGAVAILFAFLAGGVILNVLKEELPAERQSRFGAFGLGALVYAVLLLFI